MLFQLIFLYFLVGSLLFHFVSLHFPLLYFIFFVFLFIFSFLPAIFISYFLFLFRFPAILHLLSFFFFIIFFMVGRSFPLSLSSFLSPLSMNLVFAFFSLPFSVSTFSFACCRYCYFFAMLFSFYIYFITLLSFNDDLSDIRRRYKSFIIEISL